MAFLHPVNASPSKPDLTRSSPSGSCFWRKSARTALRADVRYVDPVFQTSDPTERIKMRLGMAERRRAENGGVGHARGAEKEAAGVGMDNAQKRCLGGQWLLLWVCRGRIGSWNEDPRILGISQNLFQF